MTQPIIYADFTDVDRTPDRKQLVSYLDTVAALDVIKTLKRQSYELMGAREGAHLLDVGRGNGDDVRALAQLVGGNGRAVGVDHSETMITEARKRNEGVQLSTEFRVSSVYQLDFADNTFDGCRAERVFQHLDNPRQALTEMIRVVKAGGKVVVFDPDWETLVIDAADHALTRKILNFRCDTFRNGWSGRQFVGLFKTYALQDVNLVMSTVVNDDYHLTDQIYGLQRYANEAPAAGAVSADEATRWLNDLEQRHQAGRFFAAGMGFMVSGRKP
jgi:ubiquinone/menaquinone biosynthesis C-methylase UbiE